MTDLLAKIRALVARSASDHEEEARTSAVQACRLITEHKIKLSLPGPTVEERSDEELREAALEYIRRKQGMSPYRPRPTVARARASAYARAYAPPYASGEEERGRHSVHTPYDSYESRGPAPRTVSPFDPYDATFETVRDFVKPRGIDLHDNQDGTFSAHVGQSWCKGSWNEVVRFMFQLLERGHAKVFWKQG